MALRFRPRQGLAQGSTSASTGENNAFRATMTTPVQIQDPDFLKPYEQLGKAITVSETSNSTVEVILIPAQ